MLDVEGSFLSPADDPLDTEAVDAKIRLLDDVYAYDYKDAGFIFDGGGATGHYLRTDSDLNLTGNRVLYRSWLHKSAAEFANTRTFNVRIGADFMDSTTPLVSYYERVDFMGNGGREWDFVPRWTGDPEYVETAEKTPIRAVQSGSLQSLSPYPDPPAPLWPEYERGSRSRTGRKSPLYHGNPVVRQYTHYTVSWVYYFTFPEPQYKDPTDWSNVG